MMRNRIKVSLLIIFSLILCNTLYFNKNTTYAANATTTIQYTGEVFTYQPTSYDLKIEVWGAQGGKSESFWYPSTDDYYDFTTAGVGGLGGYASCEIQLETLDPIQIYVGGKPQTIASDIYTRVEYASNHHTTYIDGIVKGYWGHENGENGLYYDEDRTGVGGTYWHAGAHSGAGGGSSAVVQNENVILSAGGGGGAWGYLFSYTLTGGDGGGPNGGAGATSTLGEKNAYSEWKQRTVGRDGFPGNGKVNIGQNTVESEGINSGHGMVKITVLNTAPPVMNTIIPQNNETITTQQIIPKISISDDNNNDITVKCYIDNNLHQSIDVNNTSIAQDVAFNAISTSTLSGGAHTFKFVADDGHDTKPEETVTFYIDKTPPLLTGEVTYTVTDTEIQILGSATDSGTGMHNTPYRYTVDSQTTNWTTSTGGALSSLTPNTQYATKFEARDVVDNILEVNANKYTLAQKPNLSIIENGLEYIEIKTVDNNPVDTEYQFMCNSQYITSTGNLSGTPQWITLTDRKIRINGLTQNESYTITSKARNKNNEVTETTTIQSMTLPPAPNNLTASAITTNSITLNWDAVNNTNEYEIWDNGSRIATSTAISYTHNGLSPGTSHTYQVTAVNDGGFGTLSDALNITTRPPIPDVPSNVTTAAIGINNMTIDWDDMQNATNYDIAKKIGEEWITQRTENSQLSYTGLLPKTSYIFKIRAVNSPSGCQWPSISGWSSEYTYTTNPELPVAPQINQISYDTTKTTIELDWEPIEDAASYKVLLDGADNTNKRTINVATGTACTINGLSVYSKHTIEICGVNISGDGDYSEEIEITTKPFEPLPPTGIIATATQNDITLSWQEGTHAWSYQIEIDGNSDTLEPVTGTQYTHIELEPGSEHTYRIRSSNASGESAFTEIITVTTAPIVEEGKDREITNTVAIVTQNEIMLSWDAIDNEVEYEIEVDGSIIDNGKNTKYNHTGLLPETYHEYKVRVKDIDNPQEWSVVLTLSTLPIPPDAPKNVQTVSDETTITLSWDEDSSAESYDVEIDGVVINVVTAQYLHEGLEPGTVHEYRVRIRKIGGVVGAWSETIKISTINNKYTITCIQDDTFMFTLLTKNAQDFGSETYVVNYDSSQLEVLDLCEFTPNLDIVTGEIAGTNLSAVVEDGTIIFIIDNSVLPDTVWSGELTTIIFKAKINGNTEIEYKID